MTMSRVGPKGQVVLPKSVREALGISPGDRVVFSVEQGRAVLIPVRTAEALFARAARGELTVRIHPAVLADVVYVLTSPRLSQ